MEDVYTIKVKTKPDTRNLYPSERRYSASTVSGLAWVHIALAATSFLLACLALIKQNGDENGANHLNINATEQAVNNGDILLNLNFELQENVTENLYTASNNDNGYILVVATSLLTVFALSAGVASILASVKWYVDHNITWVLIMSILSTAFAFISFMMVLVWVITSSDEKDDVSEIYKDKIPFENYFIVKQSHVIERNESHFVIGHNRTHVSDELRSNLFSQRVLSINILIAALLEFLWSILSIKIAYKGMKSNYKADEERRGNCIEVVTKIKGNDTNKLARDAQIMAPKPDLIDHYPSKKIKRIFLSQDDNGFYLKNHNVNDKCMKQNTETGSEFYKERMMKFLNGCSMEEESRCGTRTPSVRSEITNNSKIENVPEAASAAPKTPTSSPAPASWGDTPDHTVYNQNNINFETIFKFGPKKEESKQEMETSENVNKN